MFTIIIITLKPSLSYKKPQHGPTKADTIEPIVAPFPRITESISFFIPNGKYVIEMVLVSKDVNRNITNNRNVRDEQIAALTFCL